MQVTIDLSAPEHHPKSKLPKALRDMWYSRVKGEGLLSLIEAYGCPNTGGEHTFRFTADRADSVAWLDLFQETYPDTAPEIMIIKKHIHAAFVRGAGLNSRGNLQVKLKAITQQFGYNGEIVTRPWFWTEAWEEVN